MKIDHLEMLGSTFLDVVEQLTFMFGSPVRKDELPGVDGPWIAVSMNFTGDLAGRLELTVPRAVCEEIAANILGLDADEIDSEELAVDSLREVLNQVCGHVIRAIAGEEAGWDLETPVVDAATAERVAELMADDETRGFLLEDSPVLLGLRLSDGEPQ